MNKLCQIFVSLLLIIAMIAFSGCEKHDPNLDVLEYALVAEDAAALEQLDVYVNLQTLDLRGSDCYDAIENYIKTHPQVKVSYNVQLGDTRYSPDVQTLKLENGKFELEELLAVMKHLPKLTNLELPKTTLSADQLQSIADSYPALNVTYTVELLGEEMTPDLTELDLSALMPEEIDENLLEKLRLLPALTRIQLMDESGNSNLAPVDVKRLMDFVPGVAMDYSFQLFGQTVTTADERVEFIEVPIGNEGIPEIRAALDILTNCTYFLMDDCGVDNEVMAQLRDDYPDTKVVWRVYWGTRYTDLTDVEVVVGNGKMNSKNIQTLKYCTDVMYLDIGHSGEVGDIDFVRYMPRLKVCIIMESCVSDLSPLANCPDLEWIEIVCCYHITDISPLANCTKLKGLNMSQAYGIKDISPLFGLQNMERLFLGRSSVKKAQYEEACKALPNCWVSRNWYDACGEYRNYSIGWRLNSNGTRAQWYAEIREIFRYKEGFYNGKGHKKKA